MLEQQRKRRKAGDKWKVTSKNDDDVKIKRNVSRENRPHLNLAKQPKRQSKQCTNIFAAEILSQIMAATAIRATSGTTTNMKLSSIICLAALIGSASAFSVAPRGSGISSVSSVLTLLRMGEKSFSSHADADACWGLGPSLVAGSIYLICVSIYFVFHRGPPLH